MRCWQQQVLNGPGSTRIRRQVSSSAMTIGTLSLLMCVSGCAVDPAIMFRSYQPPTSVMNGGVQAGSIAPPMQTNCAVPNGPIAQQAAAFPQQQQQQQQPPFQQQQPQYQQPTSNPVMVPPESAGQSASPGQIPMSQLPAHQQQPQMGHGPAYGQPMPPGQAATAMPVYPQQSMQLNVPQSQPQSCPQPPIPGAALALPAFAVELNQCQQQISKMSAELSGVQKRNDSTTMVLEAMAASQSRMYAENQRLREELAATDRNIEEMTQIVDDVLSTATATPRRVPPVVVPQERARPQLPSIPLPSVDSQL